MDEPAQAERGRRAVDEAADIPDARRAVVRFAVAAGRITGDQCDAVRRHLDARHNREEQEDWYSDHGVFEQSPFKHYGGQNCPACAGNKKKTTQGFVSEAEGVHGDTYGYSKVEYKNMHTPVIIECPIHGDFRQLPDGHLNGQGCPQCAGNARKSTDEFVPASRTV